MHRFVTRFYHGDYAVNDLGLVSFNRRQGAYVLDVYGLASVEASRQTEKTSEWLGGIVKRHSVDLAILYPELFQIPTSWTPLARMCVPRDKVNLAESCVVFYSTNNRATASIREALTQFAPTLPEDIGFRLSPLQ